MARNYTRAAAFRPAGPKAAWLFLSPTAQSPRNVLSQTAHCPRQIIF